MQKQLNNFSREQANLRFKSFQISPFPLQKKEKIAIVRIYLFFPWKIYLKIQFPIIEGKANNSTIIKYKLRDKWIVERVGKWTSHENSEFPQVRLEAPYPSGRITENKWKQSLTFTQWVICTMKQSSRLICSRKN